MLEGLQAKDGQTMEDAVRQFDAELMVPAWRVFPSQEPEQDNRDPNAPYWWTSDEDASASFLAAVDQVL